MSVRPRRVNLQQCTREVCVFRSRCILGYNIAVIYTTINFTRLSVTEVGALSAAGWAWSGRSRHMLRCQVGVAGCAWLLHGKQT